MPSNLNSSSASDEDVSRDSDEKFLTAAKKRFDFTAKAWEAIFKESKQQWDFRMGNQWPEDIINRRTAEGRPCQTVNWTDQFILHVINGCRQNEPEVRFLPVSSGIGESEAKMRSALYRHIEDYSQADIARDNGFESAVTGGLGYWRVDTELVDEKLNLQEVCIRPIEDSATVYMDPKPKRIKKIRYPQYCFIVEDILWQDFEEEYKDDNEVVSGIESWIQASNTAPEGWVTADTVRLIEYFWIDKDGKCQWCRMSAFKVHEKREIGIPFIPIIQDLGEELVNNGKRRVRGLTWNLMEAQVTLNYATSALSEAAGMGPKSPYMVTPTMIEGLLHFWDKLNTANLAYCTYNPDPAQPNGPRRENTDIPIQALVVWCQQAEERFRMLSGIYQSSQGAPSNEQSGKAINARKVEGELAVYHFIDNHSRALQYEAMVVSAYMKIVYDVPRVQQITKPDSQMELMVIGQAFSKDGTMHENLQSMDEDELNDVRNSDGKLRYYDPTMGDYNCIVHVGPSAPTKLAEASEGMASFAAAAPELVPRWADLYVRNQDWTMKDEIADRLVPPDIAAQKAANGDPAQQVPALTAQLQQAKQAYELLQQDHQKLMQEKQGKVVESQARIQIEHMGNETDLKKTAMTTHAGLVEKLITAKTDLSLAAAERQITHLHHLSNLSHDKFTEAHRSAHEHAMSTVDHHNAMDLAAHTAALMPKPDKEGLSDDSGA